MKKYLFGIIATATLLIVSSCHHVNTNSATGSTGTWTFKGTTYNAAIADVSAGAAGNSFYGYTGNGYTTTEGTLSVQCYGSVTPGVQVPGTYTIAHQVPPDTNQIYIVINTGGANNTAYGSIVGYGPETVTIALINGKYNVSGSGIKLLSLSNYADSNSTLSLNVTQQ